MQSKNKNYTKDYFEERDHLSLHILNAVEILLKERKGKKVLEVGVGSGKFMNKLREDGFKVEGIDASPIAAKLSGVKLGKAEDLPFESKTFDCVVAINIIEHLHKKDGELFIKEAYRVLKKDGFIFLVTPNYASLLRLIKGKKWAGFVDKTHVFFYTPLSLRTLLKKKGFTNIQHFFKITTPVIEWPLPSFVHKLPNKAKLLINFLLATSPLSLFIRDTFWIGARKA